MKEKIIEFIKLMFTSNSGISSKRVFGAIGWISFVFICLYCTFQHIQAPVMCDTLAICSSALLGLDTITGIWKRPR